MGPHMLRTIDIHSPQRSAFTVRWHAGAAGIETAVAMANHSSPSTAELHDHRPDDVTLDKV
ncbi:hypothetical protein NOLU111490_15380 [Novosphingobium lubricantis]